MLEWWTRYLEYCEPHYVPKTFEEKRDTAAIAYHHLGKDTRVDEITGGQALELLQRAADKRSGYSGNKTRKNLIAAWNWGVKYLE